MKGSIFIFSFLVPALVLSANLTPTEKRRIEYEATEALKTIISLWKDGKFEELYEYGNRAKQTSISKESFVRRMQKKSWGLASSWEAIQNVEGDVVSPRSVYVRAKIGYKRKTGGDTRFVTETFKMSLEGGRWRTDLSKFLAGPRQRR